MIGAIGKTVDLEKESQPRSSCRTAATAALLAVLASAGHKYWLLSLDDHLFCLCTGTHEI